MSRRNDHTDFADVIVVGGGHAGCEAAAASVRYGASTILVTQSLATIADMACNPAIGGIAKGHLVREIDALDGLQPRVADRTGIQFRLLNMSRGPAVQSPRAQADRIRYSTYMRKILESMPNLYLTEGEVCRLIVRSSTIRGVQLTDGRALYSKAVVLAPGTFLNGRIHISNRSYQGGRWGQCASIRLANNLRSLGFPTIRMKTGTPARLDSRTITWGKLDRFEGDRNPVFFSDQTVRITCKQIPCFMGWTNPNMHKLVKESLSLSAMYGGHIIGKGPRYCPSIEDKVVRFPEQRKHQLFFEPEGLNTNTIYLNGLSSSLPANIQVKLISMIDGLENARMQRPGYAIEYDVVPGSELDPSLETKRIQNLFHAGQINGSSGYEEAAGQGLLAGMNAARKASGMPCVTINRAQGYLGVMIDDLTKYAVDEPYRLLTSRAECRVLFRIDNADERMTPMGMEAGIVDKRRWKRYLLTRTQIDDLKNYLTTRRISFNEIDSSRKYDESNAANSTIYNLAQILKMPNVSTDDIILIMKGDSVEFEERIVKRVHNDLKYEGYIKQASNQQIVIKQQSSVNIPNEFYYDSVPGLSKEMAERLNRQRPKTLGQANEVPGITPAAIQALRIALRRSTDRK